MIAVDTNILVYAHRRDSEWHEPAADSVRALAEGASAWALPWPCVHEFLAIVTHARVYEPPTSVARALAQVDAWLESPTVVLITEEADYWSTLREQIRNAQIAGPRVHDARVAALCIAHGVRELLTADRDFTRFAGLVTRNPLIAG